MRYNPPPNWPATPPGWTPAPDWLPDPSWPPAPQGWQFWIDEGSPPVRYATQSATGFAHPSQPRRERPRGLLVGAAVLVVALVAGTVAAVVWWTHGGDAPARPERMLAGTFPTAPDWAWYKEAQTLLPASGQEFTSPVGPAFAQNAGALVAGNHILVRASDGTSGGQLMSLSISDGHVEWSVPFAKAANGPYDGCADSLLGNTLPCIASGTEGSADITFIDVDTGATVATSHAPFTVSALATNGHDLYTLGLDQATTRDLVTKGSRDSPGSLWKTFVSSGACGVGYNASQTDDLRIRHGLVLGKSGSLASGIMLRDRDGSPLFDHDVTNVSVADDGSWIVSHRCQADLPDSTPAPSNLEVSDIDGKQLFSSQASIQAYGMQVYRGGPPPFVTTDGDGLDPSTGTGVWHISDTPGSSPMVIGKTLILTGEHGLTAYDVTSGRRTWNYPGSPDYVSALTDGQRLLVTNRSEGIDAVDLTDGHLDWSTAGPGLEAPALYATDAGLLAVTSTSIGLMHPTGAATGGVPTLPAP